MSRSEICEESIGACGAGVALAISMLLFDPSILSAGAIVIGQINIPGVVNPPGIGPDSVTGITFDTGPNPLVMDGFGQEVWRLGLHDASVIAVQPLSTTAAETRSLDFDVTTGRYFTSRRLFPANDYLFAVDPSSGTVTQIGLSGSFGFLDMAIDPLTGDLWLANDCANIACTSVQGGSLWKVNKSTGSAIPVQTFGTSLGQLTALAVSPQGKFFVASLSTTGFSSVYQIDPITGQSAFIMDTGLAFLSLINDMAFDPSTDRLYAIEERRGSTPRTWYLDELTGLPSPPNAIPEPGTATYLLVAMAAVGAMILGSNRLVR